VPPFSAIDYRRYRGMRQTCPVDLGSRPTKPDSFDMAETFSELADKSETWIAVIREGDQLIRLCGLPFFRRFDHRLFS